MSHGGCCNCFICKIGQSLGLMEKCADDCCEPMAKKVVKKTTKAVAKKTVTKKSKTTKSKAKKR